MKRPKRRIESVRVGNAAVKINCRIRTVGGNRYPTFEVCDCTGGHRRLRSFADHQAAVREAERLARQLATVDAMAAGMSGREAASFARCLELLRAVGDPPELPLPPDVGRAVAAYLKKGRPRCSCRRIFVRLFAPHRGLTSPTIASVVERALARAEISSTHRGAHLLGPSLKNLS